MDPHGELDGARIGAAIGSFLLGALVIRLISQGQTPVRILAECALIGAVVYLLTVVVRPPKAAAEPVLATLLLEDVPVEEVLVQDAQSEVVLASATVPDAMNASISASDFPS